MKITVDKQMAFKAVCLMLNLDYRETEVSSTSRMKKLIYPYDEIVFDFVKDTDKAKAFLQNIADEFEKNILMLKGPPGDDVKVLPMTIEFAKEIISQCREIGEAL